MEISKGYFPGHEKVIDLIKKARKEAIALGYNADMDVQAKYGPGGFGLQEKLEFEISFHVSKAWLTGVPPQEDPTAPDQGASEQCD